MQLSVFLITLGIAVVTHSSEDTETATGLTYLGVGYNILKGNPEGGEISIGGVDPGLLHTRNIFQLTWDEEKTTSDRRFKVPDQVSFAHHSSCVEACKNKMYSGTLSYQTKLMEDVKASGEYK